MWMRSSHRSPITMNAMAAESVSSTGMSSSATRASVAGVHEPSRRLAIRDGPARRSCYPAARRGPPSRRRCARRPARRRSPGPRTRTLPAIGSGRPGGTWSGKPRVTRFSQRRPLRIALTRRSTDRQNPSASHRVDEAVRVPLRVAAPLRDPDLRRIGEYRQLSKAETKQGSYATSLIQAGLIAPMWGRGRLSRGQNGRAGDGRVGWCSREKVVEWVSRSQGNLPFR